MAGTQVATLIVAAYAAALSTILGLIQVIKSARRVEVSCKVAVAAAPNGGGWKFVVITAFSEMV
jgi:hypothetical protein